MTRQAQKRRERTALAYVYDLTSFDEIADDDPPDFRVRLRGETTTFGIEVVDFFADETQARVKEIPGYVGDLINGKDVRHKQDRSVLSVGEFEIINPDGTVTRPKVTGVLREVQSPEGIVSYLTNRIKDKSQKAAQLPDGLAHVNLIICDREGLLSLVQPTDFYNVYCTDSIRGAILNSPFREIFFATRKHHEWGFIPLRKLLFLAELKLFAGAESQANDDSDEATRDGVLRFARYFDEISCGSVLVRDADDGTELIHGDCALFVANRNTTLCLRMFEDRDFTANASAVTHDGHVDENAKISAALQSFRARHTFACDLWTASPK